MKDDRFFSDKKGISNVPKPVKLTSCPRCNYPVVKSNKFCPRCGTLIDKEDSNIKIKTKVLGRVGKRKTYDKESISDVVERLLDKTEES